MIMPARMHDDAAQNDILDAIGRIALLIATSRAKVVKGDLVELSHIETTVATLCERIRSAELNNKLIIDRLMRLQAELQSLSDDLSEVFANRFGGDPDLPSQAFA